MQKVEEIPNQHSGHYLFDGRVAHPWDIAKFYWMTQT